jgi:hypothetical protein
MTEKNWEVIAEATGEIDATIIASLLESHGITVWLSQEGLGRVYQLGIGRLGRVQILVPSLESEVARELVQNYYPGDMSTPAEEDQVSAAADELADASDFSEEDLD